MSLIVIGLGIGWLIGLSITPGTTLTVITSIMTVVVLLITVVSGLESKVLENEHLKWKVSSIPIVFFVIGLAGGASVGVYARTHNWLGVDSPLTQGKSDNSSTSGGLFAGKNKECKNLLSYEGDELLEQLEYSTIKIFNELPSVISDSKLLHKLIEKQCAAFQN